MPGVGSGVADATVAVLLITALLPTAVPVFTTNVKLTVLFSLKSGIEQLVAPVPLTAGVVHVQPDGDVNETNVVLAGVLSVNVTLVAAPVPLVIVIE